MLLLRFCKNIFINFIFFLFNPKNLIQKNLYS